LGGARPYTSETARDRSTPQLVSKRTHHAKSRAGQVAFGDVYQVAQVPSQPLEEDGWSAAHIV
jgi:hypothetical protein